MRRCLSLLIVLLIISSCANSSKQQKYQKVNVTNLNNITELANNKIRVTQTIKIANISPEEAKSRAIKQASQKALEFSGVEVKTDLFNYESQSKNESHIYSSISNRTHSGIILSKKIVTEENLILGDNLYKRIIIDFEIGKREGKPDPNFNLNASLSRTHYENGEPIELEFSVSQECFFYIFNITSDEEVFLIYPNKFQKENHLGANEKVKLPNQNWKNLGLQLTAQIANSENIVNEFIKIIATKKGYPPFFFAEESIYQTKQADIVEFQQWILEIPRSEITEANLQYFIQP